MELTSREKKVISASVIDSSSRWQKAFSVFAMANFFRVANDLGNQVIGDQKSQRWAEGWSSGVTVSVII